MMYRIPLIFTPQPEGGYTVTSPPLPELVTEGDTLAEAHANVRDAFEAVVELYAEQGRSLPAMLGVPSSAEVMKYREVARKLAVLGCQETPRQGGGSHRKWHNPASNRSTVVPDWGGRDLKMGTVRGAVRQLGIEWSSFDGA
jgi:predicted RNase H-like HicB family nuclease